MDISQNCHTTPKHPSKVDSACFWVAFIFNVIKWTCVHMKMNIYILVPRKRMKQTSAHFFRWTFWSFFRMLNHQQSDEYFIYAFLWISIWMERHQMSRLVGKFFFCVALATKQFIVYSAATKCDFCLQVFHFYFG